MRWLRVPVIFALAFFLASCFVTSIYPLYTEKDLTFVPELLGTWKAEDEENLYTFQQSGKNAYELIITGQESNKKSTGILDYEEAGRYEAHLVKLGKFLFLDIYPQVPEMGEYGLDFYLVPVHSFHKILIEKDVLRLVSLDYDWLEEMIKGNKINLAHVRVEDRIVLTASTAELQKFVLKYVEDSEAFSDFSKLDRQKQDRILSGCWELDDFKGLTLYCFLGYENFF